MPISFIGAGNSNLVVGDTLATSVFLAPTGAPGLPGLPDRVMPSQWSVQPSEQPSGGNVFVSLIVPPLVADGAPAQDEWVYSIDGGAETSFGAFVAQGTYEITGLTNGVEYSIRVAAKNSDGAGAWSAPKLVTPAAVAYSGTVRYVAPSGWSGGMGNAGTIDDPYLTLATGITNSNSGDTLLLLDGTYERPSAFTKTFTSAVTIRSANAKNAVMKGIGIKEPAAYYKLAYLDFRSYLENTDIAVLYYSDTITNCTAYRCTFYPVDSENYLRWTPAEWVHRTHGSISFNGDDNAIIDCDIHCTAGDSGVKMYGTNVLLENNRMNNFITDCYKISADGTIRGNDFVGCHEVGAGLSFVSGSDTGTFIAGETLENQTNFETVVSNSVYQETGEKTRIGIANNVPNWNSHVVRGLTSGAEATMSGSDWDIHSDGIQATGQRNVIIENNLILEWVYANDEPGVSPYAGRGSLQGIGAFDGNNGNFTITNNVIVVSASVHGITFEGLWNSTIANNTLISLASGNGSCRLNLFADNNVNRINYYDRGATAFLAGEELYVGGSPSGVTIGSVIWDDGTNGNITLSASNSAFPSGTVVTTPGGATATLTRESVAVVVANNTAVAFTGLTSMKNSVNSSNIVVDYADYVTAYPLAGYPDYDYRPASGDTVGDALLVGGDPAHQPATDKDGVTRDLTTPSVGAYETAAGT